MTAYAGTMRIASERNAMTQLVCDTIINVDAASAASLSLPSGFGDSILVGCSAWAANIATMMVTPELSGAHFAIYGASDGVVHQPIGESRWLKYTTVALQSHVEPIIPALWKTDEILVVQWDEVDTNASPTGDMAFYALVIRLRS